MDEWYSYGEIRYTKDQVIFLIKNLSYLAQGIWPPEPVSSGYVGEYHSRQIRHEGTFVKPATIIAELNARLKICGKAGLYLEYITLFDYGDQDYLMQRLARYHGIEPQEVSFMANMAMRFCCGWRRKRVSFKNFCAYTKTRDNKKIRGMNNGS